MRYYLHTLQEYITYISCLIVVYCLNKLSKNQQILAYITNQNYL